MKQNQSIRIFFHSKVTTKLILSHLVALSLSLLDSLTRRCLFSFSSSHKPASPSLSTLVSFVHPDRLNSTQPKQAQASKHTFIPVWKIKMAVNISISEGSRRKVTVWRCFSENSTPKVGAVRAGRAAGHPAREIGRFRARRKWFWRQIRGRTFFFLTDDSCGGVCASCVFSERFSRGDNFDSQWSIFLLNKNFERIFVKRFVFWV